jgi:hypothetical protein
MKHTAGPWALGWPSGNLASDSRKKTADGVPYRVYHTVNGVQRNGKYAKGVAHIYLGEYEEGKLFEKTKPMLEEQLANAMLISAAPELLEACKDMVTRLDNSPYSSELEKKARAAIAKAETIPEGVRIS